MTAPMNPYEAACDRFNRASKNYPKVKAEAERILREADDEWNAAQDNLRQYESQPGIPLPQYREPATMQSPISGKTWTPPDYSLIPGYGASDTGAQLVDLDTGDDLSNPRIQDLEPQS